MHRGMLLFVRWSGAGMQSGEKAERRKKLISVKDEAVGTTESHTVVSRVIYS